MIELTLSVKGFDELVAALHRARQGSKTISVPIEHLERLLVDHGRLLRATPYTEPAEPEPAAQPARRRSRPSGMPHQGEEAMLI
jgi:hypothetical protein